MAPSHPQFREMRIQRSRALSPSVRSVVLATTDGTAFGWEGGQHVELVVPPDALEGTADRWRGDPAWLQEVRAVKRPFSIASAPREDAPGQVELAVGTGEGDSVSALLHRLPEGVRLGMVGPLGEFTRRGLEDVPAVFVATGTGVAPLRAMILADLMRGGEGPELTLLFGCRTDRDLLWHHELEELALRHGRFRYEPVLSRPGSGWRGRSGYVQDHLAELLRGSENVPVFVSGRSEMVADVLRMLELELGHPSDRILRERYA